MAIASKEWTKDLLKKAKAKNLLGGSSEVIQNGEVYSTDEVVVGCWTDGRPIYRKVMTGNVNYKVFTPLPDNITRDNVVSMEGFVDYGSTNKARFPINYCYNPSNNFLSCYLVDGSDCIRFEGTSQYSGVPFTITLEYTKTTDSPNSYVAPDKEVIMAGYEYSEEEKVVGCWTDGKPIYRKTVNYGSLPSSNSYIEVSHGILDIEHVVSFSGTSSDSSGNHLDLQYPSDSTTGQIQTVVNKTSVGIWSGTNRSSFSAVVTIEYTKTTDAENSFTVSQLDGYKLPKTKYSTDEMVIGEWIDGKPIYRKVINFGNLGAANVEKTISHGVSNIKEVMTCKGFISNTDGSGMFTIPWGSQVFMYADANSIGITCATSRATQIAKVIIEYTKTTD